MPPTRTRGASREFLRYSQHGRIRSIKPHMPRSQSMQAIEPLARYFFTQTWTQADDEGRLGGRPDDLRSTIFPTDGRAISDWDIVRWLSQLEAEGCLQRYRIGPKLFIQLLTFLRHQKIDKPKRSLIPPPPLALGFRQLELDIEEGRDALLVPHEVADERQLAQAEAAELQREQAERTQPNEHPRSQH